MKQNASQTKIDTVRLVRELRDSLAVAVRLIYATGHTGDFIGRIGRLGIEDGLGVRVKHWLEQNAPEVKIRRPKRLRDRRRYSAFLRSAEVFPDLTFKTWLTHQAFYSVRENA